MDPLDLPVEDLVAVVRIGLERGRALLTAGECQIADRIAALHGPPGRLYARLSGRVPEVFRVSDLAIPGVDDLEAALEALEALELVDRAVPGSARAAALTVAELKQAAARLGLSRAGKKAELVARVAEHPRSIPGRWLRIRHRGLIRRLERWAFLRRHRDRSTLVVERLGHVTWPTYEPTPGPGVHQDRRALLRWEALLTAELDPQTALEALASGSGRAAGSLDLGRRIARGLGELARELERIDPAQAAALYAQLAALGHRPDPVRHARALELAGRSSEALELLRSALAHHEGPVRLGIHRAGKRLSRALRTGWAPDPPLLRPKHRALRLAAAPGGLRPLYRVGDLDLPVEQALIAQLALLGRRALHAENGLWTTLFAVLFAEAYFAPVPGALPSRWLSGPLDLGTPGFYERRRPLLDGSLLGIRAGEAPDRLAASWPRWQGVRLAGAHWDLAAPDAIAVAEGMGGEALADVLEVLLTRGWRAARGLPDLAILPGPATILPHAVPERLGPGLVLAEVKGPTDAVRDAQAVWFHRLRSAGAPIALWEVRPHPSRTSR